ncbi:MAG: ergothioneine biosynthesis protein EgtB [Rubrobacter sp.]|nr:ergothioneine biosynthesis protein EgtB [Rubrobacter sp.]
METEQENTKKRYLVRKLDEARERTRLILKPVSAEDLEAQHETIMSPLIWDYGHIGNYEELWLLKEAAGRSLSDRELYDMYDASLYPREERPSLDLLDREGADRYLDGVRETVREAITEADFDGEDHLLRGGFVYHMILQHEAQHNETMLQTLQLMEGSYTPPVRVESPAGGWTGPEMVHVPGGPFVMGTDDEQEALDNERPAHEIDLPGFYIDTTPVTNRSYVEFVEDGGYERRGLWSEEGWRWKQTEDISAPKHWYQPELHSWWTQRFGFDEALRPEAPVVHVSHYEADAYARWAGKRLPTEAEWEKAASWDSGTQTRRLFPWGAEPPTQERTNLDQLAFGTSEVGAYPAGESSCGCLDMVGNVWEWTASDFAAYPGFRAFPYDEYSKVFFGDEYKVLRGGSWVTRPAAIRNTFRNWDYPIRRQLFVGFRCAL